MHIQSIQQFHTFIQLLEHKGTTKIPNFVYHEVLSIHYNYLNVIGMVNVIQIKKDQRSRHDGKGKPRFRHIACLASYVSHSSISEYKS